MHNMRELINKFNDHEYFSYQERLQYCQQVIQGLNYLHEKEIIHMDLKPLNMLVNGTINSITVKLTDICEMAILKDTCSASMMSHPCRGISFMFIIKILVDQLSKINKNDVDCEFNTTHSVWRREFSKDNCSNSVQLHYMPFCTFILTKSRNIVIIEGRSPTKKASFNLYILPTHYKYNELSFRDNLFK